MLRLHSHHVARLVLVLTLGGAAYAGDGKTTGAGGSAAKTSECTCAACELYKADVDTIVAKMAAGEMPKTFCPDTPAEKVAVLQQHPSMFFAKLIASRPSDLAKVFDDVKARFADKNSSDTERTRMLDVVAAFPQKANAGLTAALWQAAPSAFHTAHLTVFASGGPEALSAELGKRAKSDVLAAAYFGVRGDECGRKTLAASAKKFDLVKGDVIEPALAAIGLSGLGDAKPLATIQQSLRDAALQCLDKNELDQAKKFTAIAEFVSKVASAGPRAELGWFDENLQSHCAERCPKFASADDVFGALEALRI